MNIRYFQYYNTFGEKSKTVLQYWNEYEKVWKEVPFIRVPEKDRLEALNTKNYLGE